MGRVLVERQGLYYIFRCRCTLSGETAFRLFASCGEKQEDLGVLVPMGNFFGLDTTHFAPISPEEPFAYLQRLKDAYLAEKDGQIGAQWEESL